MQVDWRCKIKWHSIAWQTQPTDEYGESVEGTHIGVCRRCKQILTRHIQSYESFMREAAESDREEYTRITKGIK